MTCTDCTAARGNPHHGMYRMGCFGCEMRGFARSTLAFDAVHTRSAEALRKALAKSHPKVPVADALKAVWEWWRTDHETEDAEA